MLLRLRQACDHPLLVKRYNSTTLWKSSVETAMKLPREKQLFLLKCLEASLALCGICNVCFPMLLYYKYILVVVTARVHALDSAWILFMLRKM